MLDLKALHSVRNAEDAVRLFSETEGRGLYVAGGTVVVSVGSPNVDFLIDLSKAGLDYIRRWESPGESRSDGVAVGATVTAADLARSDEVAAVDGGLLREAVSRLGSHTIRNRATVGGNIAFWSYPADLPPALLALDALLVLRGVKGERSVTLRDFYSRRSEVHSKGDLIVEVRIPPVVAGARVAFEKMGRLDQDVAIASAAVVVACDGHAVREARIALGAVATVPFRALDAEEFLVGRECTGESLAEAARIAVSGVKPRRDHRASSEYRGRMAGVAVQRALLRAVDPTTHSKQ
ncbi:FAD binding domain-containing protein [bacterium]|nr:FAD binding domain-containing protein [bacterium]